MALDFYFQGLRAAIENARQRPDRKTLRAPYLQAWKTIEKDSEHTIRPTIASHQIVSKVSIPADQIVITKSILVKAKIININFTRKKYDNHLSW